MPFSSSAEWRQATGKVRGSRGGKRRTEYAEREGKRASRFAFAQDPGHELGALVASQRVSASTSAGGGSSFAPRTSARGQRSGASSTALTAAGEGDGARSGVEADSKPALESPLVLTPVEVEAHACRLSCPMRISGRVVWEETYEANSGMILQNGDIVEAGTSRSWPFF